MDSITTVLALFLGIIAWIYRNHLNKKNILLFGQTIPGPTGWRSVKDFLMGAKNNNLHIFAGECARRYGDIVKVSIANQCTVFLNHPRTIRKLFGNPDVKRFSNDRPPSFISTHLLFGEENTAFSNHTPIQSRRRKTIHSVLKFYGHNVCQIESNIMNILSDVCSEYQEKKEIDISTVISETILKIIHTLISGVESSEKHLNALRNFNQRWDEFFVFEIETALQMFPFLSKVPYLPFKEKFANLVQARNDLIKIYYDELKESYVKGQERGFVDNLFSSQQKYLEAGDEITMTNETIKASVCEITAASYVSSKTLIQILFLIILRHEEIQERMYNDIKAVINDDEQVSLKHRSKLPYIEAAILETMRYSSNSPFLLPHFTQRDISFEGFHIPQNSALVMNVWHSNRREDLWKDPWTFNPERFLTEDGQLIQADDPERLKLIAFGAGLRICPAENFAKSRLFLVIVTLIKNFEFFPIESEPLPSENPRDWKDGYVVKSPRDFKCGIKRRNQSEI